MPTVIVYWSPGRSKERKAAVARQITAALVDEGGAKQSDVLIIFQNILPGDAVHGSQVILTNKEWSEAPADSEPLSRNNANHHNE